MMKECCFPGLSSGYLRHLPCSGLDYSLGMPPPTVIWVPLNQLAIEKMPHTHAIQNRRFVIYVSFFPDVTC